MIVYNKLVRDKIPELIEKQGEVPHVRILEEEEYLRHLEAKLDEEAGEYHRDKNAEELADILEVVTYLFISHDLSVVKYISDRIGVMYLGNMVELADKETIFKDPRHPYTVALLSSIPTTDPDSATKERIILEGNIPSPIKPPTGCKFHTRCYMATEKCSRIAPTLQEVEPNHFVACHYPQCKLDCHGEYLFDIHNPKVEDLK